MARKLKPGEIVNGFVVDELVNNGQRALAYAAHRRGMKGAKVFLKQYKSPSIAVKWYKQYLRYESDKRDRLCSTRAGQFCVKVVDFFEADLPPKCYFQAFEFVEGGTDLQTIVDRAASAPASITWDQRLIFARVMMAGVRELHEAKIVHGDLKPANLQMIADSEIEAGYQLKLIDMDASVLVDKPPPWTGYEGDVGSPNYFSPEHLSGKPLQPGSDVFTCGLILYQLLTGRHPCWADDHDAYVSAINEYRVGLPNLLGPVGGSETTARLRETLRNCLNPNLAKRPAASSLHDALKARTGSGRTPPPAPTPPPPPAATTPPRPTILPTSPASPSAPRAARRVVILRLVETNSGKHLDFRIRMRVSRRTYERFGPDSRFYSDPQFELAPDGAGSWTVAPLVGTAHHTLLNGRILCSRTPLKAGDRLAVGKEAAGEGPGVEKLPMRVELVEGE